MRYVLGSIALAAALIIVGCSATQLFLTAFNSVQVPWQQWLLGAGMAAIVAWEAGAILVIGYCFKIRHWVTGIGAIVLLVLAMAVTSRQELRLYVGGQADVTASRSVQADDRKRVRAELERAYLRRDTLQSLNRLTKSQDAELRDIRNRIADLERRWDTRTEEVHASGRAEGELANRLLGFDVDLSQALLDTLPLWFWMFARVFAVPAAAVAIAAMRREGKAQEPRTASKAPEGITLAARPLPAVLPRTPLPEPGIAGYLTRKAPIEPDPTPPGDAAPTPRAPITPTIEPQPRKPELATDGGKRLTKAEKKRRAAEKAERAFSERIAAVEAFTDQCLEVDPLIRDGKRGGLTGGTEGKALRKAFKKWAGGGQAWRHLATVDESHLGRAFTAVLDAGRNSKGIRYGAVLKVKQPAVRRAA